MSQTLNIEELTKIMGAPDEVRLLGQSPRTAPQGPPFWPWNSLVLAGDRGGVGYKENPIELIEIIVDRLFIRLSLWDTSAALLKIQGDVETVFGVYGSINAEAVPWPEC